MKYHKYFNKIIKHVINQNTIYKFIVVLAIYVNLLGLSNAEMIVGNAKLVKKQEIFINGDTVVPAKVSKEYRTPHTQDLIYIDIKSLPTEITNTKTFGKAVSNSSLTNHCNSVETGNEAAFKILFINYNSYPIPIEKTASWIPIYPANNSKYSILGIDSDNDCIRDDIERYIGKMFPRKEHKRHRKYLFEYAKWLGIFLKGNPWNVETTRSISRNIGQAAECVRRIHGTTSQLLDDIFAEFHNTFPRSFRYIKNRGLLGGWAPREKLSISCP